MLTECLIIILFPSLWKISGIMSFRIAGRNKISQEGNLCSVGKRKDVEGIYFGPAFKKTYLKVLNSISHVQNGIT